MKIIGAIIAGGHSSRMAGNEKAFLKLGGKTILDLVVGRFEPQVDQLVINANGDEKRFSEFGLEVIPDIFTQLTTPLSGFHAALCFATKMGGDILVTIPSDTPFLPINLAARLIEKAQANGAAIAHSDGQDHYIIGAWKTDLLADLERAVEKDGLFRVKDWAKRVSANVVEWPIKPYDPFFNVNTPDDLSHAEQIVRTNS